MSLQVHYLIRCSYTKQFQQLIVQKKYLLAHKERIITRYFVLIFKIIRYLANKSFETNEFIKQNFEIYFHITYLLCSSLSFQIQSAQTCFQVGLWTYVESTLFVHFHACCASKFFDLFFKPPCRFAVEANFIGRPTPSPFLNANPKILGQYFTSSPIPERAAWRQMRIEKCGGHIRNADLRLTVLSYV